MRKHQTVDHHHHRPRSAYDARVTRSPAPLGRRLAELARRPGRWPRPLPVDQAPTSAPVDPAAAPISGGSGRIGALLCHGFTGSPRSLRDWAEHLIAAGLRVEVPLLPGHGTSWQDLNRVTWTDWYVTVEQALVRLRHECDRVFVGGLSMGGALALRLAEQRGTDVAGLVLVNPAVRSSDYRMVALPVLKHVLHSLPGIASDIAKPETDEGGYLRTPLHAAHSLTGLWADVGKHLDRVDQPILVFRSAIDHVVKPSSVALLRAKVASSDVTERVLSRSYHVATMDYDAEEIFAGTVDFVRQRAGRVASGA